MSLAKQQWKEGCLQDLVFFQRGFDITQAEQRDGTVPVVSSSGITSYHDCSKVEGPGVIIGRKGTLGAVHFVPGAYWPHDTTLWSKSFHGNDPRFVYYFVQTIDFKRFDVGNSNPTLNRNHIHLLPIRIPPVVEQQRIAAVLTAYDGLIANNRRRMALLEQAARLLYDEWFVRLRYPGHEGVRVVDGVPEGWARVAIPDVAETIGGGTPSTSVEAYWQDGDIEWVTPTDVTKNRHYVLTSAERTITAAGLAASSAKLLPKHAILMSSRASIGYFAIPGREVCTNQGFIAVVCHKEEFWPYLLMQLSSRVEEIRSLGTGTTFLEVSKGKFRNLQVVRPSDPVVAAYARAVTPFFDQVRKLKQQNEVLVRARDLLLPRLMSGEVTV